MMDFYQEYIAKSRYCRFVQDEGRRENWYETVDRYMDFMKNHLETKHNYVIPMQTDSELREAIKNLEPSYKNQSSLWKVERQLKRIELRKDSYKEPPR